MNINLFYKHGILLIAKSEFSYSKLRFEIIKITWLKLKVITYNQL